jgi:hypothetical protein
MYHELRGHDHIFTLNMLAAEVRQMDSGSNDLSLSAIRCGIYRHLYKYGAVHRRVTCVAQNMRYDEGVKVGYVDFVNVGLNAGTYKDSDIMNIDEINVDFDLVLGSTLAEHEEKKNLVCNNGMFFKVHCPPWGHNGRGEVTSVHYLQG